MKGVGEWCPARSKISEGDSGSPHGPLVCNSPHRRKEWNFPHFFALSRNPGIKGFRKAIR